MGMNLLSASITPCVMHHTKNADCQEKGINDSATEECLRYTSLLYPQASEIKLEHLCQQSEHQREGVRKKPKVLKPVNNPRTCRPSMSLLPGKSWMNSVLSAASASSALIGNGAFSSPQRNTFIYRYPRVSETGVVEVEILR